MTPSPRTPAVPAGQHPSGYLSRYLQHLSIAAAQLYKIFFLGLISCHHLFLEIRAGFMLKSVCMSEVPIKLESWMRTTKLSLIESGDDLDISTLERTQPVCLGCRHRYYSDTTAGRGGAGARWTLCTEPAWNLVLAAQQDRLDFRSQYTTENASIKF